MGSRVRDAVMRATPAVWSLLLVALLLGGALGPGYTLSYDMVWVPDLSLGADALGLGTALPRAVPSDAVVAVLDDVLPAGLLQKLVLLLPLVAAGTGAASFAGPGLTARMVAVTAAVWNPFVAERLAMGHWPVLVGYGLLPWVLLAGAAWRRSGTMPARLPLLLVLGSLSATTGLVTAVAALAAGAQRSRRLWARLCLLVLAANLPWLVSGLLHAGSATSSAVGARVFAPHGEGLLPGPASFLSLGGIWNAQVVLPSRSGWLGVVATVLMVCLAVAGALRGRSLVPPAVWRPMVVCWCVGIVLTTLTWGLPGATGWLASTVPGAGVLRDGSRLLALAAPLTAVLAGRGAAHLVGALPDVFSRAMIGLACVLAPVALMPDAALGLSGRLEAVDYPESYDALVDEVASLPAGDVALLPFLSYRAPSWNNHYHPVLAPLARYLPRDVVVEDQLIVDGRPIEGEDPRAERVRAALAASAPEQRAERLRGAGIRLLVVEDLPGAEVPEVTGEEVRVDDGLSIIDVGPGSPAPRVPATWRVAMYVAWSVWCSLLLLAAGLAVRRARRRTWQ